MVGVDVGVRCEWIGIGLAAREGFEHPPAAVLDGHDSSDDLAFDLFVGDDGLLCGANVLTVACVVGVIGHRDSQVKVFQPIVR